MLLFVQLITTAVASLLSIIADPLRDTVPDAVVGSLSFMLPVLLAVMAAAAVFTVFYYVALYKVFMLYDNANLAVYLILSVLFPISTPIILMILCPKEPAFTDTAAPSADYSL